MCAHVTVQLLLCFVYISQCLVTYLLILVKLMKFILFYLPLIYFITIYLLLLLKHCVTCDNYHESLHYWREFVAVINA